MRSSVSYVVPSFVGTSGYIVHLVLGRGETWADNAVVVEMSGDFTGAEAEFRGGWGTSWIRLVAIRLDGSTLEQSPRIADGAVQYWRADVTGMTDFRVFVTRLASGSMTVRLWSFVCAVAVPALVKKGDPVLALMLIRDMASDGMESGALERIRLLAQSALDGGEG